MCMLRSGFEGSIVQSRVSPHQAQWCAALEILCYQKATNGSVVLVWGHWYLDTDKTMRVLAPESNQPRPHSHDSTKADLGRQPYGEWFHRRDRCPRSGSKFVRYGATLNGSFSGNRTLDVIRQELSGATNSRLRGPGAIEGIEAR